ncbi:sulfite oxidase heme-binding subunit YedZ [Nordella sp. HKS 07]|uniref:sulfite oxidase heme-binding subunit YedZ n=1 Tax=Nordella sp. HKS 07 TaxID=2712222 RepID=UPI001FEF4FAB|nr:protein-methionine-sulfoxide reductase heme-binding subunit MsrQ [Nordella sp. HKS 07]
MQYRTLISPWTDRSGRFSALKSAVLILVLLPAIYYAIELSRNDLGPLPYKEALHRIGDWTIRFLVITLALTPLQRILGWPKLALIRRMLGVTTFAYALAHLCLYVVNEKFDLVFVASEIVKRIYLTIGFTTLLGLSLLAATSTDWAVRKLGRNWKRLHLIVYGLAVLALLHYFIQSKIDVSQPVLWTGFFLLLMIYRVAIKQRRPLTPLVLAGSAVAAALLTAAVEFSWYGLATGVGPLRVLKANLAFAYGLRPAWIVLIVGLAVALLPWLKQAYGLANARLNPARNAATR